MVVREWFDAVVMAVRSIAGANVEVEGIRNSTFSGTRLLICGGGVVASERDVQKRLMTDGVQLREMRRYDINVGMCGQDRPCNPRIGAQTRCASGRRVELSWHRWRATAAANIKGSGLVLGRRKMLAVRLERGTISHVERDAHFVTNQAGWSSPDCRCAPCRSRTPCLRDQAAELPWRVHF